MEKILTISIAAYNAEKDIARCLDSLVDSGVIDKLDIIVVNDGSKDKTSEIANDYANRFVGSIRVVDKENGGHGSTINTSVELAVGKYYKILDSDDWVDSANLARLVDFLENNELDMVFNPYNEVSYGNHNDLKLVQYEGHKFEYGKIYDISELGDDLVLFMHSLTFNTEVIKHMGPIIDENCFYVDMEYTVFPLLYVKSFALLDYTVYQYLLGSQTQSMNMQNMIKRRDQHMKVIKRLIAFSNQYENQLEPNVKSIIQLRIRYAEFQQYRIFFAMNNSEGYKEVKEFDKWLKTEHSELYMLDVPGRFMKILDFTRNTGFVFFPLLSKLLCNKL